MNKYESRLARISEALELMGDPLEDEEMDFMVADASYREGMHQMSENDKLKYLKSSWTDTLLTESEDSMVAARSRALEGLLAEMGFRLSKQPSKLVSPIGKDEPARGVDAKVGIGKSQPPDGDPVSQRLSFGASSKTVMESREDAMQVLTVAVKAQTEALTAVL